MNIDSKMTENSVSAFPIQKITNYKNLINNSQGKDELQEKDLEIVEVSKHGNNETYDLDISNLDKEVEHDKQAYIYLFGLEEDEVINKWVFLINYLISTYN